MGSPGPHAAAAQADFVAQVRAEAPDVSSYRSGVQLIRLGTTVCVDLGSRASVQQVADRVPLGEGSAVLPPAELGAVIGAAVHFLCPRYRSALAGSAPGVPAA